MSSELAGIKELNLKLSRLERKVGVRVLTSALQKATTPVRRQMRHAIPKGTEPHRTYRGVLVSPGFAKRSIKRVTGKKYLSKGRLSIAMGVRAQAFYAINFIDRGPHKVYQRKYKRIKPYTIRQQPWFAYIFIAQEKNMLGDFARELRLAIEKAVR